MANSLHPLFQAIATARDERELRLRFMDSVGDHFGVQHWGIHLLDDQSRMVTVDIYGKSDRPLLKSNDVFTKESAVEVSNSLAIQQRPDLSAFLEYCEKTGRDIDPVVRYVIERHAPAHEQMVLSTGDRKQRELYQQRYASYGHIMMGPIIGGGHLIGTVHFARGTNTPAFNAEDLADLSAICTHLSACLAVLRSQPSRFNSLPTHRLTQRELQIAELVAQGLTNAEIGSKLWITQNSVKQALKRMFRKLNVSARTEMVAKLRDILDTPRIP